MLADFGLSRIMEEEKLNMLTEICGTPGVSVVCQTMFTHVDWVAFVVYGARNFQEKLVTALRLLLPRRSSLLNRRTWKTCRHLGHGCDHLFSPCWIHPLRS